MKSHQRYFLRALQFSVDNYGTNREMPPFTLNLDNTEDEAPAKRQFLLSHRLASQRIRGNVNKFSKISNKALLFSSTNVPR